MEQTTRYRVRGLDDVSKAHRAERVLNAKAGIHEVRADPMSGQIWVRYESEQAPPDRLEDDLRDAGLDPVGVEPGP